MSDAGRRYYNAAGGFLDAPDELDALLMPRRERREWEADMRDHDDREPDPLGGIYREDEPQEWRA